jgi:hypothetical protein
LLRLFQRVAKSMRELRDQAGMILPVDDASGADLIDAAIGDVVGEFATGEEPFAHAVKRRLKRQRP